jgi:hypothetical protein
MFQVLDRNGEIEMRFDYRRDLTATHFITVLLAEYATRQLQICPYL